MTHLYLDQSVEHDIKDLLEDLIIQIHLMNSICNNVSIKHETYLSKTKLKYRRKQKKYRIFSSSDDDSSSSDDSSTYNTLINEDSDSDSDEQKALRTHHGLRTRHELVLDDLPPIENLTITLSDETSIELIGHVRHIIDEKLVIIESLLHSPPLNDDSVLFNSNRRSIGLIFETFGPVEKPYYSIRYNDIHSIHQRQIELNQEVFYAPKETTYTKYVFVQELRLLKGSDASWEYDNEPPKFAIDYSDDEQERAAKTLQKQKRNVEGNIDEQMMNTISNETTISSNLEYGRGRRRFCHATSHRSVPNWFQNTLNSTSFQYRSTKSQQSSLWQNNNNNNNNNAVSDLISSSNGTYFNPSNPTARSTQQLLQNNNSTHSVFPWM